MQDKMPKKDNPFLKQNVGGNYSESDNYRDWIEHMSTEGTVVPETQSPHKETPDTTLVPENEKERRK